MTTIHWSHVGYTQEPGEWQFSGLTIVVERKHIAQWIQDPDGVWEVGSVYACSVDDQIKRFLLTRWHPSAGE